MAMMPTGPDKSFAPTPVCFECAKALKVLTIFAQTSLTCAHGVGCCTS